MKINHLFKRISSPPGIISWRFIFNVENSMLLQHKKALLYVPQGKSRTIYWSIAIIQQFAWWLFFGWRSLFRVWKLKRNWKTQDIPVSTTDEIIDLICATFLYNIPPAYYYLFRLYKYKKIEWLQFVYDHEIPKWHLAFSNKISAINQSYINSKYCFANIAEANGIPAIPSMKFYSKGETICIEQIFIGKSFFFKPDKSSRSRGCFSLIYDKETNSYLLEQELTNISTTNKEKIVSTLNDHIKKNDYIKQPLLNNHPDLVSLLNIEKLVTIRLITVKNKMHIEPISAILEIPNTDDRNTFKLLSINVENGKINNKYIGDYLYKIDVCQHVYLEKIAERYLPQWKELLSAAKNAHQLCSNYYTVGWDIAITPKGITIIEGNVGWGTKKHQLENYGKNFISNPLNSLTNLYYSIKDDS